MLMINDISREQLTKSLTTYLRNFDPVQVANTSLDIYEYVAEEIVVRRAEITSSDELKIILMQLLEKFYGEHWQQSDPKNTVALTELIYGHKFSQNHLEEWPDREDGYFGKIEEPLNLIYFSTDDILEGKAYLVGTKYEAEIYFEYKEDLKEIMDTWIHFGYDIGVQINEFGRLRYPMHALDNLVLDGKPDDTVILPKNIQKGAIYIAAPWPIDCREYMDCKNMQKLRIDKTTNWVQFGDGEGEVNIEIASDFIVAIKEGKMVNAWLKFQNLEATPNLQSVNL